MKSEVSKILRAYDLLVASGIAIVLNLMVELVIMDSEIIYIIHLYSFYGIYLMIVSVRCYYGKVTLINIFTPPRYKISFMYLLLGFIVLNFVTSMSNTIVLALLPFYRESIMINILPEYSLATTSSKAFYVILVVVIGPIVEELFFRGVLLNRLKEKGGAIVSVVIVSLSFGLLHGDIIGTIYFSIFTIILTRKYNSLIPPILFHVVNNAIAVIGQFTITDYSDVYQINQSPNIYMVLFQLVIVVLIVWVVFKKNSHYLFQ